jgi:hypothetical protein
MRLLLIGDIHGDSESFVKILSHNLRNKFDAILLVGDIGLPILNTRNKTNEKLRKFYEYSVKFVLHCANEFELPVLYVPGNWDLPKSNYRYKYINNIDIIGSGNVLKLHNFNFLGIGGSSKINNQFPYEWNEQETFDKTKLILENLRNEFVIILSHDPPFYSKLDLNHANIHSGSQAVRKLISSYNPIACISGHIHEGFGVDIIGSNTLCINAGMIKNKQTYGVNVDRNNIDISFGFEEQFVILDLSRTPIFSEQYFVRFNQLHVIRTIMQNKKLIAETPSGQNLLVTTGDTSYPSKIDYFNKLGLKSIKDE